MTARPTAVRVSAALVLCGVTAAAIAACTASSPGGAAARPARPGAAVPAATAPGTAASETTAAAVPPRWRESKLPALPGYSRLTGGAAVSGRDAWAVGWSLAVGRYQPEVLHWNGQTWSRATVAGIAGPVMLESVVAPGPRQVWVSGQAVQPVGGGLAVSGVIYRLEGSRWVSVPPLAEVNTGSLYSGPDGQIWMTGTNDSGEPVIAYWTGRGWRVSYTAPGNAYYVVQSLDIVSARNGWAAGYTQATYPKQFPPGGGGAGSSEVKSPLLLHWNGISWRRVAAPHIPAGYPGGGALSFIAAAANSPGMWATGTVWIGRVPVFVPENWLLRWNGTSWATVTMPRTNFLAEAGYSIGNISAGKSGVPQWIGGRTNTDVSWYLYYSGNRWIAARGVTTPGEYDGGMQVVAIPGTNATWAIGTSVSQRNTDKPRIEYAA
jgi:hypothetical protein